MAEKHFCAFPQYLPSVFKGAGRSTGVLEHLHSCVCICAENTGQLKCTQMCCAVPDTGERQDFQLIKA